MTQHSFRVALAGWGLAGRNFHAPFIVTVPGLDLVAVATSREPEANLFSRLHVVPGFDELLDVPDIDVVVIATPNALHASQARAALEAGYHVVVEKPAAPDSASWAELVTLAAERQRLLVPYHNRRWDGDFYTVRSLLRQEALGPVHFFGSTWPRYRPEVKPRGDWKAAPDPTAGVLYDLGSHLVDQVLFLFGAPERVSAQVECLRPDAVNDDWMRITLEFPPSAANPLPVTAVLEVDSLNAAPGPRFQLRGRDATFVKYGLDPQEAALRRGEMPGGHYWGTEGEGGWGTLIGRDGMKTRVPTVPGRYGDFYRGLYAALCGDAPPPVDPADATLQLRVLEAARLAAENQDIRFL